MGSPGYQIEMTGGRLRGAWYIYFLLHAAWAGFVLALYEGRSERGSFIFEQSRLGYLVSTQRKTRALYDPQKANRGLRSSQAHLRRAARA